MLSALTVSLCFAATGLQFVDGLIVKKSLISDSEVDVRIAGPSTLALGDLVLGGIGAMQRRKSDVYGISLGVNVAGSVR